MGWAFSLAAATVTPLLVLGIWTNRLTAAGGAAGLLAGSASVITSVAIGVVVRPHAGWPAALLAEPAPACLVVTVVVMLGVSSVTSHRIPEPIALAALARMHRADE